MSRSLRAHLLLLVVVSIWGATFALVKGALTDISPLLFNLIRMSAAFLCLLIFYRRHLRAMRPPVIAAGAVVGLCLAMGYQFQTAGLQLTTPSKSAFITGLVVVLVPLLAAVPGLRTPQASAPRWNAWLGAAVAFFGIVLLTTPAGTGFTLSSVGRGDWLTLVCALGFSLHVIALSHFSPRYPFEQLAVLQIGFCALSMALSLPLVETPFVHWTPRVLVALAVAALLATAAAFTIQSWAQRILPPTHTALILALEPVFAWITSFVCLGERLQLRSLEGAVLILSGIACTELFSPAMQPAAAQAPPLL
jgi:drug/metabolite transporter (DMT)-like permease